MATTKKQELAVIDFAQFSVAQLPELKGKKEEIASVIEANPIVEIVDNATYESAKKSRTAVRTLRTSLESEQKTVKKKIKEHVLDVVDKEYDTLVLGVKSAEQSRQEPIDVWEKKKEEEKQEKARLEQERIDKIKAVIQKFRDDWESVILDLVFGYINPTKEDFEKDCADFIRDELAEFDVLFDREVSFLTDLLNSKIKTLTEQEQIRIDNLLIQEKNAEQTSIQEWQRTWNANIDTLSVSDVADVKSILVKSKLANLKHYVSGYEEIYLSTEKRLHSQIEFVSKAEEQRIAQEKLDQEKKELEETKLEQWKLVVSNRKQHLVSLGFVQDANGDYRFNQFCFLLDDVLSLNADAYSVVLEDAMNYIESVSVESAQEIEVVAEEVIELPALDEFAKEIETRVFDSEPIVSESITINDNRIVRADYVGLINVLPPNTTDKIDEIANNDAFIQTEEFEETWEGINKLFEKNHYSDSGFSNNEDAVEMRKLIFEYLEKHFNVPTKKQ